MRFLTLKTDHHVCIQEDSDRVYFFSKMKCDEESGFDMLNLMAMTGKIDKDLWEKSKIIVSQALLDSLKDAYRQRRNSIITIEQIRVNNGINGVNSGENPTESEYTAGLNHKGKERKVNKDMSKLDSDFDVFYQTYPKHIGRKKALDAWVKIKPDNGLCEIILGAIEKQKTYRTLLKTRGEFVPEWPHPATWLNGRRWEDEIEEPIGRPSW